MKNLVFISVCSMVLLCGKAEAQTGPVFSATGGCSSVTTANTPSYQTDLWGKGLFNLGEEPCVYLLYLLNERLVAQYTLQKLNTSNNTWVNVAGPQISSSFNNISEHGTYRVNVSCPVLFTNQQCPEGIDIHNNLGQYVGQFGTYTNGIFATSNIVIVGPTTPSDIAYTFIDPTPNDPFEAGYDFGEVAKINTSASTNYNQWWLAISEDGPSYQRYRSNGWTNGTVPNNLFDLSDFWDGGVDWQFETFHSYTVQFVIENLQCRNGIEQNPPATWNVLNRTFFICPAGTGCRIGEEAQKIVLSPNPASSVVRLLHFEMDAGREYRLTIADLSGRAIRSMMLTSNEVDISGFEKGMYAVTIERDGKRIFTDKLVVNQ